MKTVKLTITILEEKYKYIQSLEEINTDYATTRMLYNAVKKAKPLLDAEWISEKVEKTDWKGHKRQYFQSISCANCHSPNYTKTNYCPNCGANMRGNENG